VLSGVFVFVAGQIFIEFFLKPIRKYNELKADTAFCLRFYRAQFINCVKDESAQKAAHELAAKFIAYSQEKPFWFFKVRRKDLLKCCEHLTLLHYYCYTDNVDYNNACNCENEIVKILNLYWSS